MIKNKQMVEQNSSEEIDLTAIFNGFRKQYHRFLVWLYRGIRFCLRTWYLILGIIVIGLLLGLFLEKENETKESTLIVQINFETIHQIYDAVDQLNTELSENNTQYLKESGLIENGEDLINSIKIEPLINLEEIFPNNEDLPYSNIQYLQTIFDKSNLKGDLLTSDMLINQYKNHKITITSSDDDSAKVIKAVLNYLNNNSLFEKSKDIFIKNIKIRIEENKKSIAFIDSIVAQMGNTSENNNPGQLYFNTSETSDIHLLFQEKTKILKETNKLENELLKYDHTVSLLNQPILQNKAVSILSYKKIVYPIALLVILFVFMQLRRLYLKAERLNKEGHYAK